MYKNLSINEQLPTKFKVTAYTGFKLGGYTIKANGKSFLLVQSPLKDRPQLFFNLTELFSYVGTSGETYYWMIGRLLKNKTVDKIGMNIFTMDTSHVCIPFHSCDFMVIDCLLFLNVDFKMCSHGTR